MSNNINLEAANIDVIIKACLQELEAFEQTKKQIIIKYAQELAKVMKRTEDVGRELIVGLRREGYTVNKGYVYKVLKDTGVNYCRGFEKFTLESGRRPLSKNAERYQQKPSVLEGVASNQLTQADYDTSALIDQLHEKIKDLENNNQQLLKEADQMRMQSGFKWFSAPIAFVQKQLNRYKEQGLDNVWFITEEGYVVNIVDREPKDQKDAESMI